MSINTPNPTPPEKLTPNPEVKMPNEHPEKQGLFAKISDMLRNFSNMLGFGEKNAEGKNKPNAFQEFFAKITGIFNGIDIEKGATVKNANDIEKIREAFRPIIDLDETSIQFKEGDFIIYNKEQGIVEFYPADSSQKSGHAVTPTGVVPISKPSPKVQQEEQKRAENTKDEPNAKIETQNNFISTPFSRNLTQNLRPHKSGPDSCGRAVRKILESFGMKNPPRGHGNEWYGMMKNDPRFMLVPVNSVKDIPPGAILTFSGKGRYNGKPTGSAANQEFGHVEIKGANGLYTSFYSSETAGGSVFGRDKRKVSNTVPRSIVNDFEKWKEATGFTGAFIPLAKNKEEAKKMSIG